MNKILKEYYAQIKGVAHVTFDPKGPGVVRIHLIPPKKLKLHIPWAVIINGQDILPLNGSWAILLNEFIKEINKTSGIQLPEDELAAVIERTITTVKKIFPKTERRIIKDDLSDIVNTLVDISKGITPSLDIGYMTLAKYAKYMNAPHRMDLMISAMSKNNCWNCNQKCLHCYAGDQQLANVKEISTTEWKKVIDECQKAYIPQVTFTGGEPTMRDDLIELVQYASWFVTRLNTNGVRLTKNLCNELYNASLDSIQVTLYDGRRDVHNLLVGSNHYDDTVQGIKNALEAGINTSINTPLCSINKDYVETIKFAEKLGVRYFTCSGLIQTGNACTENSVDTRLSSAELLEVIKNASQYCHAKGLDLSFTSPGLIKDVHLKDLKLNVPACGACLSNMGIAPNGDVVPCQSWLSTDSLGNLLVEDWKQIWNSKKCKQIRKTSATSLQMCQLANQAKAGK